MSSLVKIENVKSLSPNEKNAYDKYIADAKPPLSALTAANLFELYVNGCDCEEIARLNPTFGLGIIVRAKVDFDWDIRKEKYLDGLFGGIKEKTSKVHLEAIDFAANTMTVYHKIWNDKFKKYIQTGKEEALEGWNATSKSYEKAVETLMKLTGQDSTKKQEILHKHSIEQNAPVLARPMSSSEASDILKALEADRKKE